MVLIVYGITFPFCTYDHLTDSSCSSIPETVSFSADILPVLNTHCSTLLCHSGSGPAANLNLEDAVAYASLSKPGSGYINTVKPNYSIFYSQLNSLSLPMPPDGKLDPCTIMLILNWLEQGALNN
ncbi:MAG TPA: hypothetical protein VFG10_15715 [Saprospiraceae bacterium]|nr:hypothetical protein [Saprospiraceae bacterium]